MTKQYKVMDDEIIEISHVNDERNRLKEMIKLEHPIFMDALYILYIIGIIFLGVFLAITCVILSVFTHEFFHLITIIYFGAEDVDFYVSVEGFFIKGGVIFTWEHDNITEEEYSICLMAGSFFNMVLWSFITLYILRKRYPFKPFALIPSICVISDAYYWYNKGYDYERFIELNPTINTVLIENLLYGIIILIYIFFITIIIGAIIDGIMKLKS